MLADGKSKVWGALPPSARGSSTGLGDRGERRLSHGALHKRASLSVLSIFASGALLRANNAPKEAQNTGHRRGGEGGSQQLVKWQRVRQVGTVGMGGSEGPGPRARGGEAEPPPRPRPRPRPPAAPAGGQPRASPRTCPRRPRGPGRPAARAEKLARQTWLAEPPRRRERRGGRAGARRGERSEVGRT